MDGRITGFIVWAVFGCMFIGLAIYVWFSKKPAGFWANVETLEVFDIKKYNHAVAKLFGIFGIVLIALGVPLLAGQNSAWIMFSVLWVMAESVVAMAVYSLGIEKRYRKRQ